MLLRVVLGKVNCVPKPILCELYGVKFSEGMMQNSWSCHAFPKR